MVWRRTAHAAYDASYHLVWSPKYRKRILEGALAARVEEMFTEIAEAYGITIDEMEVSPDHVHIFCSFPPRYSIAQVVTRFKSLSARAVFLCLSVPLHSRKLNDSSARHGPRPLRLKRDDPL